MELYGDLMKGRTSVSARPGRAESRDGRFGRSGARSGMTLVEVVVSLGIVTLAAVFCIGYLMANVRMNRLTAIQVAALQAVNGMAGEIEDLAGEAGGAQTAAYRIVKHFKEFSGEKIAIGPGRTELYRVEDEALTGSLVYRFRVPAPGDSRLLETDPDRFVPNYRAVGVMRIFLDERILNADVLPRFGWTDLSSNPVLTNHGMDIDLNGNRTDNFLHDYGGVKQLAISIAVTFYNNEAHEVEVYSISRNLVFAQIKDATKGLVAMAP